MGEEGVHVFRVKKLHFVPHLSNSPIRDWWPAVASSDGLKLDNTNWQWNVTAWKRKSHTVQTHYNRQVSVGAFVRYLEVSSLGGYLIAWVWLITKIDDVILWSRTLQVRHMAVTSRDVYNSSSVLAALYLASHFFLLVYHTHSNGTYDPI